MQGKPCFRDYRIMDSLQVNFMHYSASSLMVSICNTALEEFDLTQLGFMAA